MDAFVIGISSKLDETVAVAMNRAGHVLATLKGKSCSHVTLGRNMARRRAVEMVDDLMASFGGDRDHCQCLLVGAAGIDSPKTKEVVTECFCAAHMLCPVICLNDGNVALHTTTQGVGMVAVAGKGSIVVGRNPEGLMVRCGGYPITIHGDEGSAQWIALEAMHWASRWLDGSASNSALISAMDQYFSGLDIEKMTECARALRRRPVDTAIAHLVIDCARDGDEAAAHILQKGAGELFEVAHICANQLGFGQEDAFLCGVWGDVFLQSECYLDEYRRLFGHGYPHAQIMLPNKEDAEGCACMAIAWLNGEVPYMAQLQ